MNKILRQYPYGFVFTDEELHSLPQQYCKLKILKKYNYYYDQNISLGVCQDENNFVILHGHFKHVGINGINSIKNRNLPKALLNSYCRDYTEFLDLINFIGGRYVIIIGNKKKVEVFPDACACRSAYYALDRNILASHVNLITDNFKYDSNPLVEKIDKLAFNHAVSPYKNIKGLLSNISLNFFSKSTSRFFPLYKNIYRDLTEEERFSIAETLWKEQLDFYIKNNRNIIFSLTAGHDSRMSFAMAREHKHNPKIKFFTYSPNSVELTDNDSNYQSTLKIDRDVVQQIVNDSAVNHEFLLFNEDKKFLTDNEINVISKNSVLHHGRYLLKHYQSAYPEKEVMHIRANLLEIGRAHLIANNRPNSIQSVKNTFDFQMSSYKDLVPKAELDSIFHTTISDFHYDNINEDYHLLDLYYWENKNGRWFSEVLNETDAVFNTFLPYNMRAIIDITLSFDVNKRRNNYFFDEMINRNYPSLNFYGKNEVKNLYEQIRDEKYFNNTSKTFKVYGSDSQPVGSLKTVEDKIFIPKEFLLKGFYSELQFIFSKNSGAVKLEILNKYFSKVGQNYLQIEVLVNNELLVYEDIACWNLPNNICLMNLKKGDSIQVRVKALRKCQSESWERASELIISSYDEVLMKKELPYRVSTNNPFSKIIDNH